MGRKLSGTGYRDAILAGARDGQAASRVVEILRSAKGASLRMTKQRDDKAEEGVRAGESPLILGEWRKAGSSTSLGNDKYLINEEEEKQFGHG
jgi:hypothetical protein